MSNPTLWHQQALQMRMPVKNNSEHVPHFALVPIGSGPDARYSRQGQAVFRQGYLDADIFVPLERKEMIDNRKIARRLTVAMLSHALINGREVIQHLVRTIDIFFEKAEQAEHAVLRYPKRGDMIDRLLGRCGWTKAITNFLRDGGDGGDHTSSGSRSRVVFCRDGCIRSRMEGSGARTVSCGPTTQLSGRCSVPIAFCNNSRPSRKASGRGGQPGT